MKLRLYNLTLTLLISLFISGCFAAPDEAGSTLPPTTTGNVSKAPNDEAPVVEGPTRVYEAGTTEMIEYIGTSN